MEQQEDKMIRISATIPESVAESFKELCKTERRSVSAQITLLMEQALRYQQADILKLPRPGEVAG